MKIMESFRRTKDIQKSIKLKTTKGSANTIPKHAAGKKILCFFYGLSTFLAVNAEITFSKAEDAVLFAKLHAREKIIEKELILENMHKTKLNVQDFLPHLSISFSESNSVNPGANDTKTKNLQFSLNHTVINPGRKLKYNLAKIEALYAYKENQLNWQNFENEIAETYFNCLLARQVLALKTELLEKTMEEEKILHKQFQLGMLLETDFLEYMTSVLQIENQRAEAEKNYKIQKGILNLALGLEEFAEIEFRDPLTPEAENAELEEHSKSIWNIVKNRSIELQKQDMAIEYSRKQQKYSDAWYLPNFSIKPSVSFSGEDFPLAKPNYSFQMSFSFENIPFAPVSISNNYSFSDKKLTGVSNSGSTNSFCQVTYLSDKRTAKLTLLQQQIQRQDNEKKMYSNLYQQIVTHDNYLKKITLLENTKKIQEKRLEFSKMQTEQGFIKPIKYLEQLIELSDTKNSLLQAKIQTIAAERIIAILTGIPFKELINAIY